MLTLQKVRPKGPRIPGLKTINKKGKTVTGIFEAKIKEFDNHLDIRTMGEDVQNDFYFFFLFFSFFALAIRQMQSQLCNIS